MVDDEKDDISYSFKDALKKSLINFPLQGSLWLKF